MIPRISGQDSRTGEETDKKHNESVKAEREGLVAVVLDKRSCVFSREKRQDNINTTKSLILAQDER